MSTLLEEAVRAPLTVVEEGRRVKKSKLSVAFTQIVNKAAGGDLKAFGHMLRLLPLLPAAQAQGPVTPAIVADREIALKLAQRLVAGTPTDADPEVGRGPV